MNFEIEDITVGNERNVIGVGETITFELSVELGNNITFSGTFKMLLNRLTYFAIWQLVP